MIRTYSIALATSLLCWATTPASAWEFREFMNAQGDEGMGLVQSATNAPGIQLAFGCDGDRWRQVALLPAGPDPLLLASDGEVAIGFEAGKFTPDGTWKVRDLSAEVGRERAYFAPAPTPFMGRLYREEQENPSAVLHMRVRPSKKAPIVLDFPVRGLRDALAKHLWKPCKLDIYFGDPE